MKQFCLFLYLTKYKHTLNGRYDTRYYAPTLARFISADTLVPDPTNPQSFNRYAYVLNSPLNHVDSTGHCTENYQDSPELLDQCIQGWNAINNKVTENTYGSGGNGEFPNEWINDLLLHADIDLIETLMRAYDIDYGYTYDYDSPYREKSEWTKNSMTYGERPCDYWQPCYEPLFPGNGAIEIGTPIGAIEFGSAGTFLVFDGSTRFCEGYCVISAGPESQVNFQTGETLTGVNVFAGVGIGGEVAGLGTGVWAGTEISTVSPGSELIVSHSNLIHAEFLGFSIEINYTSK